MATRVLVLGLNPDEKPLSFDDASNYLERLLDDFDEAAQDEGIYVRASGESLYTKSAKQFSEVLMGEEPNPFHPDMLLEETGIKRIVRYDYQDNGNILYVVPTAAVSGFAHAITDKVGMDKSQIPEDIKNRELLFIDTYGDGNISTY